MSRTGSNALILAVASVLLQAVALFGIWQPVDDAQWLIFGALEMLLIVLLLLNGGLIMGAVQTPAGKHVAGWGFVGLLLCSLGDLVNRNFSGEYFGYDNVIAHSYLADSVWFFLPGYLCLIYAAGFTTAAAGLSKARMVLPAVIAVALGGLSFWSIHNPAAATYLLALTGAYALVISVTGAAALWLLLTFGWRRAGLAATGFALALVADAIIGQFWLFGEGAYPAIRHINWIIYFSSQALIQTLPALADTTR